jgi:hypothetical protein
MTITGSSSSRPFLAALLSTILGGAGAVAWAQAPAPAPTIPERVAALKESLAKSAAALRQYEWIETTAISLKGEEKSRTQNRCYYGADGKKQEVPVAEAPAQKEMRGIRGKIAENKKEELSDYMKLAVALLKSYVPPDPARIQASKDAGKVSISPLEPGKRVRLDFKDYQKAGDTLSVDVNPANNTLLGLKVATWLEDAKDVVNLDVTFGALNDGTTYAETIALDAPSQKLAVNVANSGYRKP